MSIISTSIFSKSPHLDGLDCYDHLNVSRDIYTSLTLCLNGKFHNL